MALGCYFTVAVTAGACSVLAGGLLVEYLPGWRWCFGLFAAVGLVLALVAAVTLPETGRTRASLDLLTALAGSIGLILLSRGVGRALEPALVSGSGSPQGEQWLWFTGAAVLLAVAATGSRFGRLPLRELLARYGAYLTVALLAGGLFGTYSTLTYVLQLVYGYSPLQTGEALLPSVAATVAAAVLLPAGARAVGVRWVAAGAALLAAGGFWWLAQLGDGDGYLLGMLPALLLVSVGAGGAISVPTAYAYGQRGELGARPASLNSSRNLGLSLGLVLISGLGARAAISYSRTHITAASRPARVVADPWLHAGGPAAFTAAAVLAVLAAAVAVGTLPAKVR